MESENIIHLLDNTPTPPSKFMTEKWVEVNDARGRYNANSQTDFKTTMLKLNLCDYSDSYNIIRFKGNITVANMGTIIAQNNKQKNVIFSICSLHNQNKQYTSR